MCIWNSGLKVRMIVGSVNVISGLEKVSLQARFDGFEEHTRPQASGK